MVNLRYFFLLFLLFPFFLLAQNFGKIKNFSEDLADLEFNHVYTVTQDSKGYLWIATDKGVIKYNGNKSKVFNIATELPSNDIFQIYIDKHDRIWLSGYYDGLYFIENDIIKKISNSNQINGLLHFYEFDGQLIVNQIIQNKTFFLKDKIIKKVTSRNYFYNLSSTFKLKIDTSTIIKSDNYTKEFSGCWFLPFSLKKSFVYSKDITNVQNLYYNIIPNELFLINQNFAKSKIKIFDNNEKLIKILTRSDSKHLALLSNGLVKIYTNGEENTFLTNFINKIPYNLNVLNQLFIDNESNVWLINNSNELTFIPNDYENIVAIGINDLKISKIKFVAKTKNFIYLSTIDNKLLAYEEKTGSLNEIFQNNNIECKSLFSNTGKAYFTNQLGTFELNRLSYKLITNIPVKDITEIEGFGKVFLLNNHVDQLKFSKRKMLFQSSSNSRLKSIINFDKKKVIYNEREIILLSKNFEFIKNYKINHLKKIIVINNNYLACILNSNKIIILNYELKPIQNLNLNATPVDIQFDNKLKLVYVVTESGLSIFSANTKPSLLFQLNQKDGLLVGKNLKIYFDETKLTLVNSKGITFIDKRILNKFRSNAKIDLLNSNFLNNKIVKNNYVIERDKNTVQLELGLKTFDNVDNYELFYRLDNSLNNPNWKIISNNNLVLNELNPGNYDLQIILRKINKPEILDRIVLPIYVKPYFYETLIFKLFIILILLLILFYFILLILRVQKKKSLKQLHLYNLEIKALKAQMNPHFIFNAINNLQTFIFLKDELTVNKYILNFARLLRLTLDNVNLDLVSVKDEIDYIKSFIEFENIKNDMNLRLKIISKEINLNEYKIPTLLLQPLIENAIIHGFKNKIGNEQIEITIKTEFSNIRIEVSDNGVGFDSDKKNNSKKQKSYGTSIIKERLKIMNDIFDKKSYFIIYESNDYGGTKVVLILPKCS